ncbi:MAG: AAA family ATPase [Deltaproteobacteria bacterium]|nr:AAA family ATPase [Deltaproteobacteria bacterium]
MDSETMLKRGLVQESKSIQETSRDKDRVQSPDLLNKAIFDKNLQDRFKFWMESNQILALKAATLLKVSTKSVSLYLLGELREGLSQFELKLSKFLDNEYITNTFCPTTPTLRIWKLIQSCKKDGNIGLIVGPAGIGKTFTLDRFEKTEPKTIKITAGPGLRRHKDIYRIIEEEVNSNPMRDYSFYPKKIDPMTGYAEYLGCQSESSRDCLLDRLEDRPQLIIVDEAHFLTWESFEELRRIHDITGTGVVYVGMERLYDEMIGRRGPYIYDQLRSRIEESYFFKAGDITIDDIHLFCKGIYKDIDRKCLKFLYDKAQRGGYFRVVSRILRKAIKINSKEGIPINFVLLEEIDGLLER